MIIGMTAIPTAAGADNKADTVGRISLRKNPALSRAGFFFRNYQHGGVGIFVSTLRLKQRLCRTGCYAANPSFRNASANAQCIAIPRAIALSSSSILFECSPQQVLKSPPSGAAPRNAIAPGTFCKT